MNTTTNPQSIFVTGAGGFIGSHLVEHLARRGHRVRALVRYCSSGSVGLLAQISPSVLQDVDVVYGDVRDTEQMDALAAGCEAVVHLAALIGIPYSYEAPRSYVATNVTGTQNVLEAARRRDLTRVVVTSTSEVYGTAQHTPIREDHRLHPQSPYAASKVAADQLGLSYQRSFGLPVVVARPFNTYGPRQSQRAVIPTIAAQVLSRGDGRIQLGATAPRRDLTFVEDTVEAFRLLVEAPHESVAGETFNFASGTSVTVGELAQHIGELAGHGDVEVVRDSQRLRPDSSEVLLLEGDASQARERLGWQPRTGLRDGLTKVLAYMRSRPVAPLTYCT